MNPVLYIIDAPNMVHRAAAMGEMQPGLEGILRRFLKVASPRFAVAAWDDREASFRRDLWPEYKAGSRPVTDDLDRLMDEALAVFDGLGLRSRDPVPGTEAHDVIATVAHQAPPDFTVMMLSSDRELVQLIDDRTFLANRRAGQAKIYRRRDIRREYGIEPSQWPAVMALAGGKHGIPGLPGIGFKGACALLGKYGDLETLVRRCRTVERKSYRYALEGGADDARLFLRLTTLRTDLPIECERREWQVREPQR